MVDRQGRLEHAFLSVRSYTVLSLWLFHLCAADVLLSALLVLSIVPSLRTLTYNASSQIAASIWIGIQHIFTSINGANIIISGAEKLPSSESAIVVSNHVEWTDFYMIQALAIRSGMLGRCRWFAKQQLKWVPLLGWGLWAMGMPLVSRNWATDRDEMDRVFRGVVERRWPICKFDYVPRPRDKPSVAVLCSMFMQGSSRTARPPATRPRSVSRRKHGVEPTIKPSESICCIRAQKASLRVSRNSGPRPR